MVKGARCAVLFVHGIASGPQFFEEMVKRVPEGVSVMALLLAGHGGEARDFPHGSMRLWRMQVESALGYLGQSHERVVVVGHSMGALLAVDAVLRHPGGAEKLVLMGVPLRIRVRVSAVRTCLRLAFRVPKRGDEVFEAARHSFGVKPDRNPLHYVGWIPRYGELFALARRMRRCFDELTVDTLAFQSGHDEMVSARSREALEHNPCCRVTWLPASGHFWYAPSEMETVCRALREELAG